MKSDLDALMQESEVDAILVTGPAMHNPAMAFMTGVAFITSGDVIKKRGAPAVLFHHAMERDEAARTGLRTVSYSNYPYNELYEAAGGDPARLLSLRYQRMLADLGITGGNLVVYGLIDAGLAHTVFSQLEEALPGLHVAGDLYERILPRAMETKDTQEVERARRMGEITTEVVGRIADFLSSQGVEDETLVSPDGKPVTIGDVKRRINLWLAESGAENPEGTIFSIGRDSAVPHSTGNPADPIRLGRTIVFDIYPCEAGGGLFYDFTRTWSMGYATDDAMKLYEQVRAAYEQLYSELKIGTPCTYYMKRACEIFESMGHSTQLSEPLTEEGFVHGLGHGVGLNIHERPMFSLYDRGEVLRAGSVITLEPGLYYPDREVGVRLEDTIYMAPDGHVEILADYPKELVLPVKK